MSPRKSFALQTALVFGLLTVGMTWPLAIAPGELTSTRQDFDLGVWNLWWVAHALVTPGAEVLATDLLFHPFGTGLEVQPLTLLQTVAAAPITLLAGPVVAYHLLALASFWLAGWATALLVHELTGERAGAWLAGAAFAFSPFHVTYLPELNLLPIGFVPLVLLAELRLGRAPGARRALLAGLALAACGLASWYYAIATGLVVLALSLRRLVRGGALRLEALHWGACLAVAGPVVARLARGFLGQEFDELEEREAMGFLMEGFKGTGVTMALWSYVGLVALACAAAGLAAWKRAWPWLLLVLVFLVLSFGEGVAVGGREVPTPLVLLERLPLVGHLRYADRFFVLVQLGVAVLAGLGVQTLVARLGGAPRAARALSAALLALLLLELWPGPLPRVEPWGQPSIPAADLGDPGAVVHLPMRLRSRDGEQMLQQVGHGRPIAGGYLTRRPRELFRRFEADPALSELVGPAPDRLPADLAERLRAHGFAYVWVQKRTLHLGSNMTPERLTGPFALGARGYLAQRLQPGYQRPKEVLLEAQRWIRALTESLGEPAHRDPSGVLFRLAAD